MTHHDISRHLPAHARPMAGRGPLLSGLAVGHGRAGVLGVRGLSDPTSVRRPMRSCLNALSVMPGLVPGISVGAIAEAEVDGRNKSGHDDIGVERESDQRGRALPKPRVGLAQRLNRTAVEQVRA